MKFFSKELNRLQEEQISFSRKLEKERKRKEQLDQSIQETKQFLRILQQRTRNGNIAKDHAVVTKKQIGRLEYQLQSSKMKLSVAKNENKSLKKKIHDLRMDKLLQMQILHDLVRTEVLCERYSGRWRSITRRSGEAKWHKKK